MITVCVYVAKSVTHELFGHGVAVLLLGEKRIRRKRVNLISVAPWIIFILVSLSGLICFQNSQRIIDPTEVLPLTRSYSWIIIGLVSLIFYIFVMGPGINFIY